MYPRNLIFSASLILIIPFLISADVQAEKKAPIDDRTIVRLSSKLLTALEDIPDTWIIVQSKSKPPQIEIPHLMKSYVSTNEDWPFNKEYNNINKNYDAAERTSTTDEKKVSQIGNDIGGAKENEKENSDGAQDNIVMPDRVFPPIGSRNIIVAPTFCPQGQRMDNDGQCRLVLNK